MTAKEYKQYADLYGFEATILSAIKDFVFVSWCPKGIPSIGSRTYKTSKFSGFTGKYELKGIICHRDNSITVKTDTGNLRFWN